MSRQVKQKECIQTKRLELKSYRSSDQEQMIKLLTNAEVTKTFMVPEFQSEQQVVDLVSKLIEFSKAEDIAHLEYGIYSNDILIGFINDCGIEDEEIEIGYVIHPDYKGQGYATEAVSAVIQDLFQMGFKTITAGCFEENIASRRVMEKCGMQQIAKSEKEEYRGVSHICRYFEIMNPKEKIGIVCCSNGQKSTYSEKIKQLENTLSDIGLQPVFSNYIYEKENIFSGSAEERALALMEFYRDDEIKEIFDISGGDVANAILPYLDYQIIAKSPKMFWGYSDLTTVINAIYAKTGKSSVLFQIRNLIYEHKEQQIVNFRNTVIENRKDLFQFNYRFIQQKEMRGIVVGGNIRCFLKLAGTDYMPEFNDKILLLESYGGTVANMETYLSQLQQLGAFDKVAGILLGTFTQMIEENCSPDIETLVRRKVGKELPIAVTKEIGHGTDAKAIVIGEELHLAEE